ncbi:hypothetical protein XENOCAPTIV_021955, partial [Xenoophorus captivus]
PDVPGPSAMGHHSADAAPATMMERSIFSAKYIFVENLLRSGLIVLYLPLLSVGKCRRWTICFSYNIF